MSTAIVKNKHTEPYSEEFQGEMITIPGGGQIEMDYFDAVSFRGQRPPSIDGDIPLKMIEIERLDDLDQAWICNLCKKEFNSKEELNDHLSDHSSSTVGAKNEVVYECPFCGFEAKNKAGLMAHMRGCNAKSEPAQST